MITVWQNTRSSSFTLFSFYGITQTLARTFYSSIVSTRKHKQHRQTYGQRYIRLAQNSPKYPGAHTQLPFMRSQYAPFKQSVQVRLHLGPKKPGRQPRNKVAADMIL